jgi:hypothetical protein
MGKMTFLDKAKDLIGRYAWRIFLWSIEMTEEKYWKAIYQQEKLNLEHDQEMIKEGYQRSDRDIRRGV